MICKLSTQLCFYDNDVVRIKSHVTVNENWQFLLLFLSSTTILCLGWISFCITYNMNLFEKGLKLVHVVKCPSGQTNPKPDSCPIFSPYLLVADKQIT